MNKSGVGGIMIMRFLVEAAVLCVGWAIWDRLNVIIKLLTK